MAFILFGHTFGDDEVNVETIDEDEFKVRFVIKDEGDNQTLAKIKHDLLDAHIKCANDPDQDPGLQAYQDWYDKLNAAKVYLYQHYPESVAHAHLLSCGAFINNSDHTKTAVRMADGRYAVDECIFTTPAEAIEALQR